VKRLVMELEREHPNVKASMLKALTNVMPRHLLDRRLNPPRDLEAHASSDLAALDDVPSDLPIVPLLTQARAR
jgi:hypothetical protein